VVHRCSLLGAGTEPQRVDHIGIQEQENGAGCHGGIVPFIFLFATCPLQVLHVR
jgi:hypothetical protein